MERDPILVEREKTHGDFRHVARDAQALKTIVNDSSLIPDVQREALEMICSKIARIICGNSKEKDHWIDIAGYAKLGAEACDG